MARAKTSDRANSLREESLAANLAQCTVQQLMTTLCSVSGPFKNLFVMVRLGFVFTVGWHTMHGVGDLLLLR